MVCRGVLKALASLGSVYLAHARPAASSRWAAPALPFGPANDCRGPTVREALAGQPEG